MTIKERLKQTIAFKPGPVTFLALLVYAAIYISIAVTDDLPSVPDTGDQLGLDLDQAYADLHQIAGLPHPYNSHQNDIVRDYILQRVHDIASSASFVDIDDDLISNVTYGTRRSHINPYPNTAVYFEGSNILVRVNGKHPDSAARGAVLFSAHFDSVSTAPGATDDGMGVVTLLSVLEYFVDNRPKRTIVFNINNGEEDGLNGAHAFLEHPWSKDAKDFINLEGAGAGGRPLLFRATSKRLASIWARSAHVHAQSLTADAFARGAVKSDTDYTVYTSAGLGGLDFAFYRQRAKYHTRDDAIPSLGGKAALWSMMESTLLAGRALAEDESGDSGEAPSFFDLFGESLVVTTVKLFYGVNIALLVVGPIVVASLAFALYRSKKLYWPKKGWGRTWASLIIGGALTTGLGRIYARVNPFIIHSSGTLVFTSLLATSLLSFRVIEHFFSHFLPVPRHRSQAFLEYYIFFWILLVADTALIGGEGISGLSFITFFHAGAFTALLVGLIEQFTLPPAVSHSAVPEGDVDEEGREDIESTERTPLLAQNGRRITKDEIDEGSEHGLWILQFLLSVPFPVILITQLAVLQLNALGQTLTDGNPPGTVYLLLSFCAILSMVPLIPFAHKLYRGISFVLVIVLAASLIYCALAFPFSTEAPFKVFFQQTITLGVDHANNSVRLTGVRPWLDHIIPEIPSSWNGTVRCRIDGLRNLPSCSWPGLTPNVDSESPNSWVSVNASKTSPGIGELSIRGANTRNCRVYFDSAPASSVSVRGAAPDTQTGWPVSDAVRELRLWSREWEKTFDLGIAWNTSESETLEGRVACEWAERAGVPALEEVEAFLPRWARVTKGADGLLEGEKSFKIA